MTRIRGIYIRPCSEVAVYLHIKVSILRPYANGVGLCKLSSDIFNRDPCGTSIINVGGSAAG